MDEPINLVLVDDHPFFRLGLRAVLEQPGSIPLALLGEAGTAQQAIDLVEELVPHVLIADLQLNHDADCASGLTLIDQVRTRTPRTRVLVLTAFEQPELMIRAFAAGASGYIFKTDDLDGEEIRRAIKMVASGDYYYGPQVRRLLPSLIGAVQEPGISPDRLTRRERQVLDLIAQDYPNKQIATELKISLATVKTHVENILDKLQAQNRDMAVVIDRLRRQPLPPSS